ncbi:tetratricopeptide (TPR) repeat protein [Oikeobacillus pervagus]|uniref:Tetratricopeptide (TPR) repeat protein n=1 Tax=Oikeobacillus pervagus TaxID=1325931 RepID=A0AAJ1T0H2_9BACI|nr:GTP-binding protein [Oikeobacillus pervagus]MDQ0216263.1 tetratricopeptide (TPR) repeat protein [Oikeobacillus pervagus]
MKLEEQLIYKEYYISFLEGKEGDHPVAILGDAYFKEQEKERFDLSYIRFAQGEVYYHHKDYETAIFKWGQIQNELQGWARKNMGDAYFELGMFTNAEELYKSIKTDNSTLQSEIALQLFTLYIKEGRQHFANDTIQKALSLNPDYPNVTTIARTFFEENSDWVNAVKLAMEEAIRTESLSWFDLFKSYVREGRVRHLQPIEYKEMLIILYKLDQHRFEDLIIAIWDEYKHQNLSFTWLWNMNELILQLDLQQDDVWNHLPLLYRETYNELLQGVYPIGDLKEAMPNLLSAWVKITDDEQRLYASSALIAWNEVFPSTISEASVYNAEQLVRRGGMEKRALEKCIQVFESIQEWAGNQRVETDTRLRWLIQELANFQTQHLMVIGTEPSKKPSMFQMLFGDQVMGDFPSKAIMMYSDFDDIDIREMTYTYERDISGLSEFYDTIENAENIEQSLFDFKLPNHFLQKHALTLVDTPELDQHVDWQETFRYIPFADQVLFLLNAETPLNEQKCEVIKKTKEISRDIPIHFFLNIDSIPSDKVEEVVKETEKTIKEYAKDAPLRTFTKNNQRQLLQDLEEVSSSFSIEESSRVKKILYYLQMLVSSMWQQRTDIENDYMDRIHWNQDMQERLNGAIHQLKDLEEDKTNKLTTSYSQIFDEIKKELMEKIPNILRECTDIIKEESDFRTMHDKLNQVMNERVQNYLQHTTLPLVHRSFQEWIQTSKEEFDQAQNFLNDMCDGFNFMYGEERLKFDCDYKILDDWHRDGERMTVRAQLENENILNWQSPSQMFLKSAGKILGALQQNQLFLKNQFKKFIENHDYEDVTKSIMTKFFIPFDLFGQSLDRDIKAFFKQPFDVLVQEEKTVQALVVDNERKLAELRTNSELFEDPLNLFKVRLHQYSNMVNIEEVYEYGI